MSEKFCTFTVDKFFFGIPVERVQEVIRNQKLTRVPLAAREVRGLINLRGQIVTALDLRRRLGLPDRPGPANSMNVLLKTDDSPVSLLVDQIEDVIEADAASVEAPPETLRSSVRRMILGASKQKDRLLLILDTDKAANVSDSDGTPNN